MLSISNGLFGAKEVNTTAAIAAGLIEVPAFATLTLAAVSAAPVRQARGPVSPAARMLEWMRTAALTVNATVVAVSVAVLALFGIAVTSAGRTPAAVAGGGMTLKTATIGGVTVLTNATGHTLYWFAPDTPVGHR